ncbi:tripartite tricarboxylate transporter TctB family protein [Pelagibacterium luteolum]|uniref:Tripartite tricarboxylate transporter TctB family protein n=1 Tax=Pelagibacterium luteolum TaxID=440168 RepID=A0A1G8ABU2_9HYPH|nr:tripartite tricarboxylate transporter TctB family protein [Pelagibacterium luteolum]SDH18361.1 Tripartite tricarboxylate transporter TctB family protein [Pelagibacterium luteolum]
MLKLDLRDIACGVLLLSTGIFIAGYAWTMLDIGTIQRMGPGMFPMAVGVLLAGFGIAIAIPAFFRSGTLDQVEWRSTFAVLASLAAFALMLRPFGLIPAAIALIGISALAEPKFRLVSTLALCIFLPALAYLIFSLGLGLPLTMFAVPF